MVEMIKAEAGLLSLRTAPIALCRRARDWSGISRPSVSSSVCSNRSASKPVRASHCALRRVCHFLCQHGLHVAVTQRHHPAMTQGMTPDLQRPGIISGIQCATASRTSARHPVERLGSQDALRPGGHISAAAPPWISAFFTVGLNAP
ncbi:Uncharacterised protein [Escherichia coli]|nr:Uncharacterised protein [Escherichia coli]